MNKKQIIELLKSGDFTIAYHDNGVASLYKGRHKYENLPEDELDVGTLFEQEGYCPGEVALLVKALGGRTESI